VHHPPITIDDLTDPMTDRLTPITAITAPLLERIIAYKPTGHHRNGKQIAARLQLCHWGAYAPAKLTGSA
jgi:hypothetical protein